MSIYQQKKSIRSFKILMLEMSKSKNVSSECEGCKDRFSNSTQAEECDQCSIIDADEVENKFDLKQDCRLSRALGKTQQKYPISHKLIQKSINFLLKASYLKNLNFQTTIHSICLFYCSLTHISITKTNIQPILCSCILLSCKLHDPSKLSLNCIVELINYRWDKKQIILYQSLILQQLDFDIQFRFPLVVLLGQVEDLKQGKKQNKLIYDKLQYLAQILLIQQPNILYDVEKVLQIYEISKMARLDQVTQIDRQEIMRKSKLKKLEKMCKIRKIMEDKKNLCEIVVNKYKGKFDIVGYCGLSC